jgi:uncharacterized protein (DUF58 family)
MTRTNIPEAELRRFARLAAPMLQGTAAGGFGPRAARNRPGRGLEFLDTRQYAPGDDVRMIDWRQSARGRDLVIRRYRDETAADWFLCVDCSGSVGWGGNKWPLTVQLASALAYTLLYAGHRVALVLFSDRINGLRELGRGAHQYAGLISTLFVGAASAATTVGAASSRDNRGKMPLPQPSRDNNSNLGLCTPLLSQNSNVIILSDFLEPDGMRRDLKAIRARAATVNAVQILDEDETQIPAREATTLRDVESGATNRVELSDQVVERAAERLASHSAKLTRDCAGLGIRFTTCRTGQRWQRVLLDHLRH